MIKETEENEGLKLNMNGKAQEPEPSKQKPHSLSGHCHTWSPGTDSSTLKHAMLKTTFLSGLE